MDQLLIFFLFYRIKERKNNLLDCFSSKHNDEAIFFMNCVVVEQNLKITNY